MLICVSSKVKDVLESAFSVDEMYCKKTRLPMLQEKVKDGHWNTIYIYISPFILKEEQLIRNYPG